MKETMQKAKMACMLEIISFPLFLWTYSPDKVFFWILLIVLDTTILKFFDIVEVMNIVIKPEYHHLQIRWARYQIGGIACLIVLAFKNLPLALYLLLNDVVVDCASFFIHYKAHS